MREVLKKFIPPILFDLLRPTRKYGFFGNYPSWQEALRDSGGYDNPAILEKVKNSLLKVKRGEAVYERDSVLFDQRQYSWPVLTALLWAASQNKNRLNVLDFGGSLGSSYFQNRDFLRHLDLRWNIVEQKAFAECGRKYFEDEHLRFYENIGECLKESRPNLFLASSSIQYVKKPYEVLGEIINHGFEYIVFDRTAFSKNKDRLTVQKVSPRIYDARYPAWFLNKERFLNLFKDQYSLVAEFDSLAPYERGFIFKRK